MKPGAPWSIKGIDPDAREAAKEKARAAGMTLGQWLNATITGSAEATQSAVPPPSGAPGSALDTARIMRAIAELARRVDILAVGGSDTSPDTARIEQQLETLEGKLNDLSQASPPGVDQARLERGMISIARRIEAIEATVRDAADTESLRDSVNQLEARVAALPDSLANHEQAARPDMSRIEASLDRLEERLQATEVGLTNLAKPSPDGATDDDATRDSIRKLMNGMVNLSRMMEGLETKLTEKVERLRDEARDQAAAERNEMSETLARLEKAQGGGDTEASASQLRAHIQAAMAPLAASIGRRIDDLENSVLSQPDTTTVSETPAAPEEPEAAEEANSSVQYDTTDMSRIEPVITEAADEPILLDTPAEPEPSQVSSRALRDSEMDAVLQQEPLPAALMDDDDAFFREVPREQPLPDYDDEPAQTDAPEEEAGSETGVVAEPALPEDRNDEPERPAGLLPVEELLADAPAATSAETTQEPVTHTDAPAAALAGDHNMRDESERRPFRLDEPLDLSRQPPPEPARSYPGRRRWIGYLVFALIFLGLLVAGYWFVGTQQYRDLSRQIGGIWDNAMVGVTGLDEDALRADAPAAADDVARATDDTVPAADAATPTPAATPVVPAEKSATAPSTPAPAPAPVPQPTPAPPSPLERLIAQANSGDPDAQFQLGVRTRDGVGIEPNYSTAADWFDLAAQQGHVKAQLGLGIMYRQGLGRPQDLDLAKVWLHAAARAGDADAQKYLGEVYVDDRAGVPDYFQAARWFREAAEQGLVDAQYNMGVLYEGGLGVPRDFEQAYYWFFLARQAGDQTANEDLARVAALLTPEQRTTIEGRSSSFAPATGAPAPALPATSATGGDDDIPLSRRDLIKELQSLLVARGYDPGAADGLPGAKTRDAIQQWQRDTGRAVKGQITEQVLQALSSGG